MSRNPVETEVNVRGGFVAQPDWIEARQTDQPFKACQIEHSRKVYMRRRFVAQIDVSNHSKHVQ